MSFLTLLAERNTQPRLSILCQLFELVSNTGNVNANMNLQARFRQLLESVCNSDAFTVQWWSADRRQHIEGELILTVKGSGRKRPIHLLYRKNC